MKITTVLLTILFLTLVACPLYAADEVAQWVGVQPEDSGASGTVVYTGTVKLDFDVTEAYLKFTCYTTPNIGGTHYRSFVNFVESAGGSYWRDAQYVNVSKVLHPGDNEIDIEVKWTRGGVPGPILARLFARGKDKDGKVKSVDFRTDPTWVYSIGAFEIKDKAKLDRPTKHVTMAGTASSWESARNPLVMPKIDTSTVVGVTNVPLSISGVGGKDLFSNVEDCGDKFYYLSSMGCAYIEDSILGQNNYQQPGQWFWGYDKEVAHDIESAGFELAVSPDVSVPADWYLKQQNPAMARILGQDSNTAWLSPWGPDFCRLSDDLYSDLKQNMSESVRAICPVVYDGSRKDWLVGDDLAKADFRDKMLKKYTSLDALNTAWGTSFKSNDEIVYPKQDGSDSRRRNIDFAAWYSDFMTDLAARVCSGAKKQFPDVPVIARLNANDDSLQSGQDFSAVPRALAKVGARVRVSADTDLAMKRIASACKFYGCPMQVESPLPENHDDLVKRLFIDAEAGCSGLATNPVSPLSAADVFSNNRRVLRGEHSITEIALFHPTSWYRSGLKQPESMRLSQVSNEIRDVMDYDVVDENMVFDGALDKYQVLAMLDGNIMDQPAFDKISKWVGDGGTLLMCADELPITDVEGNTLVQETKPGAEIVPMGKGQIVVWDGAWDERQDYYSLIYDSAYPSASDGASKALDDKHDGVWSSLFKNRAIYLNTTDAAVTVSEDISEDFAKRVGLEYDPKKLKYSVQAPAHAMVTHFLSKPFVEIPVEFEASPSAKKLTSTIVYRGGSGTPGSGLRLTSGNEVTCEFNIPEAAIYGFACMIEPVGESKAQLRIDGKNAAEVTGPSGPHDFMYPIAAKMPLKSGKHSLTLRVQNGAFIADKVMVTSDTDLAGFAYGFSDPKADQTW